MRCMSVILYSFGRRLDNKDGGNKLLVRGKSGRQVLRRLVKTNVNLRRKHHGCRGTLQRQRSLLSTYNEGARIHSPCFPRQSASSHLGQCFGCMLSFVIHMSHRTRNTHTAFKLLRIADSSRSPRDSLPLHPTTARSFKIYAFLLLAFFAATLALVICFFHP